MAPGIHQVLDEVTFAGLQRAAVDVAPVALVEVQGVSLAQFGVVVELPGDVAELWVVADADRGGILR